MAALLRHSRRISRPQISSLFFHQRRLFASDKTTTTPELPQIQPVSYAPKPKPATESLPENAPPSPPSDPLPYRNFTREEFRYMKDSPVTGISSVSYAKRVAPLPDDHVVNEDEKKGELERELENIQVNNRVFRRVFKAVEEEKVVPFPTLIKEEKKQGNRKVFDLQDALRQVKVIFIAF